MAREDVEHGRAYAVAAVLALAATGEIRHRYQGDCPDKPGSVVRDKRCMVCRALTEWDAIKRGDETGGAS